MISFLVDIKLNSGAGHIKRCLNLADELRKYVEILFIINHKKNKFADLIEKKGYKLVPFSKIKKLKNNTCIVDGYYFKNNILNRLKTKFDNLIYINDKKTFNPIFDIVVSNFKLKSFQSKTTFLFDDVQYSLVNPSFKSKRKLVRKNIQNLFINFGMSDSMDFTYRTVYLLSKIKDKFNLKNIKIASNKKKNYKLNLKRVASGFSDNVEIKEYRNEIHEVVKSSDLIIGSGGVGLLERMCSGIPSLTIITAKNQELFLTNQNIKKTTLITGTYKRFETKTFINNFLKLYKNFNLREDMSFWGKKIIDGDGVKRVSKIILRLCNNENL